jgi:cytochrome P450
VEHPGELERLRNQPGLIERAMEEFLRFDCPVQATGRRATVAMDIGGYRVEPGDFLTPVIGAANRDPMRFARPDELDLPGMTIAPGLRAWAPLLPGRSSGAT